MVHICYMFKVPTTFLKYHSSGSKCPETGLTLTKLKDFHKNVQNNSFCKMLTDDIIHNISFFWNCIPPK